MSLLVGADGRRGFCSPRPGGKGRPGHSFGGAGLEVKTWFHHGDVGRENLKEGKILGGRRLIAGVGLELLNRRRNKMAGHVDDVVISHNANDEWKLILDIENVLG